MPQASASDSTASSRAAGTWRSRSSPSRSSSEAIEAGVGVGDGLRQLPVELAQLAVQRRFAPRRDRR